MAKIDPETSDEVEDLTSEGSEWEAHSEYHKKSLSESSQKVKKSKKKKPAKKGRKITGRRKSRRKRGISSKKKSQHLNPFQEVEHGRLNGTQESQVRIFHFQDSHLQCQDDRRIPAHP